MRVHTDLVKTTSATEWLFVVDPSTERLQRMGIPEWPIEQALLQEQQAAQQPLQSLHAAGVAVKRHLKGGRVPRALEAFDGERLRIDSELAACDVAPLLTAELIGARLYTGPCFAKYNAVLRQHAGCVADFEALCRGNTYTCTLHACNSALIKLSKLSAATTVYRGLGGAVPPEAFFTPDEKGICGGVEFAFLSTTAERSVAIQYASRGGASTVVELSQGLTDRGADLSWCSQYPAEREITFPPLSHIHVQRCRVDGDLLVVEGRVSINTSNQTLEQVVGRMRTSHLALLDLMSSSFDQAGAPRCALRRLRQLRRQAAARTAAYYNDIDTFGAASQAALRAQRQTFDMLAKEATWSTLEAQLEAQPEAQLEEQLEEQGEAAAPNAAPSVALRSVSGLAISSEQSVAKRMYAAAELCARSGQLQSAVSLLRQRLSFVRPDATAIDAALRQSELTDSPAGDRWRLEVAAFLLQEGATPPWPAAITALCCGGEDTELVAAQVGALAAAMLPPDAPPFRLGAECLILDDAMIPVRWRPARVAKALKSGKRDCLVSGWKRATGIPQAKLLAVRPGGAAALLRAAAAQEGCAPLMRALLMVAPHSALVAADEHARGALHHAAAAGVPEAVELLLAAGASTEVPDSRGRTARRLAIESGHAHVAGLFDRAAGRGPPAAPLPERQASTALTALPAALMAALESGDVGATLAQANGEVGTLALVAAAWLGHRAAVCALLGAGVDIEATHNGDSALSAACRHGHAPTVAALLEARAAVNAANAAGCTPLWLGSQQGDEDVVELLLAARAAVGAAMEASGESALLVATLGGHDTTVQALLDAGVPPDAADGGGWSPLLRAAQRGYDAIVVQLLEARAALETTTARDGLRALHLACRDGHAAVVRHLLAAGADAGAADRHGKSVLFYACTSGQEAITRLLLRAAASVNAASSAGVTPLHVASAGGHVGVISLLLQAHALADASASDRSTALSRAVDAAEPGAVRRLLQARRTPLGEADAAAGLLHAIAAGLSSDTGEAASALAKKKAEVFELLLGARCDINAPRASDGRTVLMVAAQSAKAAPLMELLFSSGADPNCAAPTSPASSIAAAAREVGPLRGLVLADGVWGATAEFSTVGARDAFVCAGSAAYFEVGSQTRPNPRVHAAVMRLHPDWYPDWRPAP